MYNINSIYKPLVKQLALVFMAYTICRVLFITFNYNYFKGINITDVAAVIFYGLRFDCFSIAATNALFILLANLEP